jgi:hypothetical protein
VRHRATLITLTVLGDLGRIPTGLEQSHYSKPPVPGAQGNHDRGLAERVGTPRALCIILDAIPAFVKYASDSFLVRFEDGLETILFEGEFEIGEPLLEQEWSVLLRARARGATPTTAEVSALGRVHFS